MNSYDFHSSQRSLLASGVTTPTALEPTVNINVEIGRRHRFDAVAPSADNYATADSALNALDGVYALRGTRTAANTPCGLYANEETISDERQINRSAMHECDLAYKRAMNLMCKRCPSVRPTSQFATPIGKANLSINKDTPPRYFYVSQHRPSPMPPLKVWNGYRGNVYFEPIKVNQLAPTSDNTKGAADHVNARSVSKRGSGSSSNKTSTRHPGAVLDRKSVMSGDVTLCVDEALWIMDRESTGSLRLAAPEDRILRRHKLNADARQKRICRGLVTRKSKEFTEPLRPLSAVKAGTSVDRVQTSFARKRPTRYSSSVFYQNYRNGLPPIEDVTASLCRLSNDSFNLKHL